MSSEPTLIWGNLGNLAGAAAGIAATSIPQPWGVVAAAGFGLLSAIFTVINRQKVTPNGAAVVKSTVDAIRKANPGSGV